MMLILCDWNSLFLLLEFIRLDFNAKNLFISFFSLDQSLYYGYSNKKSLINFYASWINQFATVQCLGNTFHCFSFAEIDDIRAIAIVQIKNDI